MVVIDSAGLIKIANRNVHKLFGYKKDELIGKNVSVLMGPPYNSQHNGFLRRYMKTQTSTTVLDQQQRLEARERPTPPLSLRPCFYSRFWCPLGGLKVLVYP